MIYETGCSMKGAGIHANSYEELIAEWEEHIEWLKEMQAAGVEMENDDGLLTFLTEDMAVAKRFEMRPDDWPDDRDWLGWPVEETENG